MPRKILVEPTEAAVIDRLCSLIEASAKECLSKESTFHLGVSGGSLAKFLCKGLPKISTEWSKWRIMFCDERMVGPDSPDSTWGLYRSQLVPVTELREDQFLLVDTALSPEDAAKKYQADLEAVFGVPPRFDLLLLGAGPDGHTCSLFPGHPLMKEPVAGGRVVAHIEDSPKPPPNRVTLTLPAVNSASRCIFAATGAGKAEMMKLLLGEAESDPPLPARMVEPADGEVVWILDSAAAAKLGE